MNTTPPKAAADVDKADSIIPYSLTIPLLSFIVLTENITDMTAKNSVTPDKKHKTASLAADTA